MELALNLNYEENDLIEACIHKDRDAQQLLYKEHYSKMMGVCLRYSNNKDDALDILHEGFIKVFRNISKYQPGTSLSAWMRRIMVNTAIDFYRKNVRRRTENLDALSQVTEKEILLAIQTLSPAYRSVFNLYVIEGFSHKEIANELGITESTSRSNLVKARHKLRAILAAKSITYGE
jgi:RNA polymerase sigma factor (sigma-70 family)